MNINWQRQSKDSYQIQEFGQQVVFHLSEDDIWKDDFINKRLDRRRAEILVSPTNSNCAVDVFPLTIQYKVRANWRHHTDGYGHVILGQLHIKNPPKENAHKMCGQPYFSLRWQPNGDNMRKLKVISNNSASEEPEDKNLLLWFDFMDGTNPGKTSHRYDLSDFIRNAPDVDLTITIKLADKISNRQINATCTDGNNTVQTPWVNLQNCQQAFKDGGSRFKFGLYATHKEDRHWSRLTARYNDISFTVRKNKYQPNDFKDLHEPRKLELIK